MAVLDPTTRRKPRFIDKDWLRRKIDEHDAKTGFVPIPGATGEQVQAMILESMLERGIDPNTVPLASREICAMREE